MVSDRADCGGRNGAVENFNLKLNLTSFFIISNIGAFIYHSPDCHEVGKYTPRLFVREINLIPLLIHTFCD